MTTTFAAVGGKGEEKIWKHKAEYTSQTARFDLKKAKRARLLTNEVFFAVGGAVVPHHHGITVTARLLPHAADTVDLPTEE